MSPTHDRRIDDATLVAWIDDELEPVLRDAVADALAASPALRERETMLRAARAELARMLGQDEGAETRAETPLLMSRTRPRRSHALELVLAAAAVLVVTLVLVLGGAGDDDESATRAENQWLAIKVVPLRGGWPLFSDVAFDLEGSSKTARTLRVVPRTADDTPEALATKFLADPQRGDAIPVWIEMDVVKPDATIVSGTLHTEGIAFGEDVAPLRVRMMDFHVNWAISPYFTVRPEGVAWHEDFMWTFGDYGTPAVDVQRGFVADEPGDLRVRFRVRTLPAVDGADWPQFEAPLALEAPLRIDGEVGAWSEEVDGMRARIVAARRDLHPDSPVAIALQLQNQSSIARCYNVHGTTMAKVPQPLHFDLVVDGERWEQRNRLGVIIPAETSFLPHPVGSVRSLIVLPGFWRNGDVKLDGLPGRHQVAFRFDFKPSVWDWNGRSIWFGKIDTPPIELIVAGPK